MRNVPGTNGSDNEVQWMLRLQKGDEGALDLILDRYEKPVLNFAYKYVQDASTAEDVAQDVFLQVYKRRKSYKPTGKLSTWIFTIAAHRCLNLKRSQKTIIQHSEERDYENMTPEKYFEDIELQNKIWKALNELPGKQRAALLLAKFEEMPLEEIAEILKTTEGAVKQLLHRAKASLRDKLEIAMTLELS